MKEETKLGDALTMRSSGRDVNTGLLPMFVDCHTYLMNTARHKKHCNESKKYLCGCEDMEGKKMPSTISEQGV
jgi:hypothetical protein